ncbi:MAG: TIGR03085 family metal-binding protein [Propionibacteriaceae bacterium]|nr:TIGR03085 family metal-binding protein [Propionibacteriaceae bacterium]
MTLAQRQRAQLLDLFAELGPFAPTLCEGWKTQDLAAHLYIREHKPRALPGMGMARFSDLTDRIQMESLHKHGFLGLVDKLRKPSLLMRPLDAVVNGAEYFIHHMDVLRANGRDQEISAKDEDSLRTPIKMFAGKTAKAYGDRVVVDTLDGKKLELGQGTRTVHLVGKPSEVLLFLAGRTEHANVEVIGEPENVKKFTESAGGI